ncbi:DUF4349 domain-containing protein [Anaerotruncus rubiinfantis]|uniref:DUF4349 domain-containing protein n=1 Tax=Anaerotruncus rubiinfantis TaxID=1720200 RepID=UPI0034A131CA
MMKRYASIALVLLTVLTLLLSACGGSGYDSTATASAAPAAMSMASTAPQALAADNGFYSGDVYDEEMAVAESADADYAEDDAARGGDVLADRKIIKNSYLTLETKEFDSAITQITALVKEKGGYIESQSADGISMTYRGDYYERYGNITARIPAEKLDETVNTLGTLCNVVSRSENMDDITDTYFDAQARLNSLKVQETTLLDILAKAEKLEDVITLQQALAEVRYQIESLTAQLGRMDKQVAYSYLYIELREVVEYKNVTTAPKTFGEEVSAAFQRSVSNLLRSCKGLILFVIEAGPVLLFWAVIILVIVLAIVKLTRTMQKRREAKRAKKLATKEPPAPTPPTQG